MVRGEPLDLSAVVSPGADAGRGAVGARGRAHVDEARRREGRIRPPRPQDGAEKHERGTRHGLS